MSEQVGIPGWVVTRNPPERYCEECANCVLKTTGQDRYIGCLEGMLSMDPEMEHKRGVPLFLRDPVQREVERMEWVEIHHVFTDGETEPAKAEPEYERQVVARLVDVEMIRRSEVKLYGECGYFKSRVYVEKSKPIDDNPKEWEIDPESEMNKEEDDGQ